MAQSSLLGIDQAITDTRGRDAASLGPSDTSDTGSDIAGIEDFDDDAMLPVDVALAGDRAHVDNADDVFGLDGGSDSGGTGERRAAGGDSGIADGADIAPDRIVSHPDADLEVEGADVEVEALLAALDDDGADAEDGENSAGSEGDAALRPRVRRSGAG